MRQRDRNRVVMRCPGIPDRLSLTQGGPVPLVCGFMGGGLYSPGVARVVYESFRVRDGILEKWLAGEKKFMVRGVGMKKKRVKKKCKKKSCRVNCTAGLTNCTHLKGTSAATSYCSFNFLVLVVSTLRKTDIFPFQQCLRLIHFVPSNLVMDTANQTSLQKKTLADNHGLKGIKKRPCAKNSHSDWFVSN